MKITFVVPHFPPHVGGGEQLYFDVCKSLMERGHEIRVVTSCSGGILGHQTYEGIDVYYCNWKMAFGHPIVRTSDISGHIKWCDIVHTAIYSTALKTVKTAKKIGKPCVTTVHEVMGDKWRWFEKNPLKAAAFGIYESLIINSAENVHVVSNATKRDYLKFAKNPGKCFMIYNFLNLPPDSKVRDASIDFRDFFDLKEDELGILYFGRPASNKGIFVLLDAIKEIKEDLKDKHVFFCMILAKDPEKGRRRALDLITEYGIQDHVRIKQSLPRIDLLKVVSGADACVIPSITEGFGYSACEACYYHRPVIASDGGSLPEVVSGKALFFKNKDRSDLARQIRKYINDPDGCFEDQPEKTFDKSRMIDEYEKMYEEMLKSIR